MSSSRNGTVLRLIAVFKFLKAASLIAAGVGLLKLMHGDVAEVLTHWLTHFGFDPGNRYVGEALVKATNLSPDKIRDFGLVSFVYAGLFLIEGIGLWLLKRWAEWFTIIITSSLIPVEVYEIYRHPSAVKVVVLAINVAVVWYLIHRIRSEGSHALAAGERRALEG